jgi:hypothetical protein
MKSKQEILSVLNREISNASGFIGGELVARRKKSLEYYLGMPLGNEQEGRSQVISNDVLDTIESLMPSLIAKELDLKMMKWLDNVLTI